MKLSLNNSDRQRPLF